MNEIIIETEQILLGALLHRNENIIEVIDIGLTDSDFLVRLHGDLFNHMRNLFAEKQTFSVPDMGTLQGIFPENMSASLYARSCSDAVISAIPSQVRSHAEMLKEHARKREILATIKEIEAILPTRNSAEVISYLNTIIAETVSSRLLKSGADIFKEIMTDFELPPERWSTGIAALDRAMAGGLYAGFTYGFAGREKAGKTTIASTISFNLDQIQCPHMYVALEMGSREIEKRNLSRRLEENSIRFLQPTEDFKNRARATIPSKNIIYLDAPGGTLNDILYQISIARLRHGIKGFIIDYWQLVEGRERGETEEQHIRRVAQTFSNYAKKQGLWCIILAQMNKDGDLFGGGGLKKACEQLYFLEIPEKSGMQNFRWLRMEASRYTPKVDVGSDAKPSLNLNQKVGPYFEDS